MSFRAKSRAAVSSDSLVNRIEQRGAIEGGRGNGGARDDHVDRRLEAHETRETLSAAGAGNEAQLDLRKRDLGVRQRHAVVATQRQLETPAHAGAADGGDHRLRRGLDDIDDRRQERLGVERVAGELLDVGAARERAIVADDAPRRAPWDPRRARSSALTSPERNACDSAFSGGLFIASHAMPLSTL